MLRLTQMPAVLNEGAFVDNKTDISDWNEDRELEKLGVAYAEAAAEYLKLEKKPQTLYRVQVGAYSSRERAEKVKKELSLAGFSAQIL